MQPRLPEALLICCLLLTNAGSIVADESAIPVAVLEFPADLGMVEREQWGWVPLSRRLPEHEITHITIHHGGLLFPDDKDVIAYLRALQSWSRTDKDWIDNPYHFMIDRQGRLYEGRPVNYPGDTNTTYDPRGHVLIEVMGDYDQQVLSPAQLDSVVAMTSYLAQTFKVPIENIGGHKDYADTSCPGAGLYRYLQDGTIQARVQAALRPGTHED